MALVSGGSTAQAPPLLSAPSVTLSHVRKQRFLDEGKQVSGEGGRVQHIRALVEELGVLTPTKVFLQPANAKAGLKVLGENKKEFKKKLGEMLRNGHKKRKKPLPERCWLQ